MIGKKTAKELGIDTYIDTPVVSKLTAFSKSLSSPLFATREDSRDAYNELITSITLIKNGQTRSNMMIGLHILLNSVAAQIVRMEARDTKAREDREKVRRSIHGA